MPEVIVAGAGMAGLAAAAHARRRGASVLLLEKLARPGGSMRLSAGRFWRHRSLEAFRAACPQGDPQLQELIHARLDADLDWLEELGAPVVEREATSRRFDPVGLTAALVAAGGPPRTLAALRELPSDGTPVILATGGFAASRAMLARHVTPQADHVLIRAAPGATGDGLRLGLAAGASTTAGLDEIEAALLPAAPVPPTAFLDAVQDYATTATVTNAAGERFAARSDLDAARWAARQRHARAWLQTAPEALDPRTETKIAIARRLGAPVQRSASGVAVECVCGVTATLGGLRIDRDASAAPGLFAAGNDAGGVANGGEASGLAAALVLGRVAAEAALR
jgi:succinate dehydrogenase/fumarate reductase flavoprotein subunit